MNSNPGSTKNLIFLTATITPKPGVPNLKRTDPEQRLQDYAKAFSFYLDQVGTCCDGIVFVENSNSDVSLLRNLAEEKGLVDQVEFIVFQGLDYPVHYDRGYGEFRLLDYGMSASELIKQFPDCRTVIWKVTGRYIVRNLCQAISSQPQSFDLYCNCRNYPKHWVDTYFMAWTPEGYETCFRDVYHRLKTNVPGIPSGIAAEELFRSWVEQRFIKENAKVVKRFRVTPAIEGTRGADNRGYATDNAWKFQLRAGIAKLLPWVWI
ncbi:MAG: hypothetical protein AAF289_02380 [Cyanobacteria bacterium P01_A01_bin.135]